MRYSNVDLSTDSMNPVRAKSAEPLLRLATQALGTQVLRFALAVGLFDLLEEPQDLPALAIRLQLNTAALRELLEVLAGMGIVERAGSGYRNSEAASKYLREGAPESLKSALAELCALSTHPEAVARFALDGQVWWVRESEAGGELAAREIAGLLEVAGRSSVLLVTNDNELYRRECSNRWPEARLQGIEAQELPNGAGGSYDLVLASAGLFRTGERLGNLAASALRRGGRVAVYDSAVHRDRGRLGTLAFAMARSVVPRTNCEQVAATLRRWGFAALRWHELCCGGSLCLLGSNGREG